MSEPFTQIGAVILAAGASTRLGQPKQLIRYKGNPLLQRTIEAMTKAMDGPILIVSGHDHDCIENLVTKCPSPQRVQVVHYPNWQTGMGSSLAYGVAELSGQHPHLRAVLVSVCDQPHLNAEVLTELLTAQAQEPSTTVAAAYGDSVGPPVCFAAKDFPALKQLRGERGAKALLLNPAAPIRTLPFPLGAIDVDTPEDYQALLNTAPPQH